LKTLFSYLVMVAKKHKSQILVSIFVFN